MKHEQTIKAGVEMRESLHALVKAEAARRRMKMKDAVEEAFTRWLETDPVPKSEQENSGRFSEDMVHSETFTDHTGDPAISFPQEFEPWLSYLYYILEKNHRTAVTAVKSNLHAFVELTETGGGHAPPPGETDSPRADAKVIKNLSRRSKDAEAAIERLKKRGRPGRKAS